MRATRCYRVATPDRNWSPLGTIPVQFGPARETHSRLVAHMADNSQQALIATQPCPSLFPGFHFKPLPQFNLRQRLFLLLPNGYRTRSRRSTNAPTSTVAQD